MFQDDDEDRIYMVLVNDEGQYSLWPKAKDIPDGWKSVEMEGSRQECSAYVDEHWKDMRPVSLQKAMSAST